MVAGGFPCHKIVGHRKVVGIAHHTCVADAQRGQQGGDLRCPAAVGVGKAAHGVAHNTLQLHTVCQHLPGGLVQRAAGDGGVVVGVAGNLVPLVQLRPFAFGDALGAGQAAVQVEGAPDAVAVEQLDKAAVLQTAVIIAHRQHLVLAAGETGVNDLRFGVVHKQSLLFCQIYLKFARSTSSAGVVSCKSCCTKACAVRQAPAFCWWALSCFAPTHI